jgi:hypothetical protein
MEVLDGQKVLLSSLYPLLFPQGLAFGAVSVSAGVIGYLDVAAILALVPMASNCCRPAYLHGVHGPQVTKRQRMRLPIIGAVAAKDVRHLHSTRLAHPDLRQGCYKYFLVAMSSGLTTFARFILLT